jgi:hypothetical protein
VTATAFLLDGRTGYRTIGTKNAAVAGLRLKQGFAAGALVKILARVYRHDLCTLLSAIRAGEHRFQDHGGHGFTMSGDEGCFVVFARV